MWRTGLQENGKSTCKGPGGCLGSTKEATVAGAVTDQEQNISIRSHTQRCQQPERESYREGLCQGKGPWQDHTSCAVDTSTEHPGRTVPGRPHRMLVDLQVGGDRQALDH